MTFDKTIYARWSFPVLGLFLLCVPKCVSYKCVLCKHTLKKETARRVVLLHCTACRTDQVCPLATDPNTALAPRK